jgi:dolichyl-phosphate beta-glucosyltransferase
MHLERWAFDVELFMISNRFKVPVREIPVNWKDIEGSHLNVVEASITMARDFLLVRLLYLFGIWSFTDSMTA